MAQHFDTRDIDGRQWVVQAFPATEGLKLLTALAKLVGKPVGKAIGSAGGSLFDADVSLLGEAIGELADKLGEEEVVKLVKRLFACTKVDNLPVVAQFDTLFMQSYATIFRVLAFVLEVNFQIPLAGWLTQAASTATSAAAVSSDPSKP